MPQFEIFKIVPARCQETFHIGKISIYLEKSKKAEEHFDAVFLCLQGNFDFEEKMYRVHCLKIYSWFLRGLIDELRIITGNYSCLLAELHLKRSLGFHMVQSYLPTILIVVISWVSFWMDVDSVAGRTTLGVTTLLTVSSKASGTSFIFFVETPSTMFCNVQKSLKVT